MDERPPITVQVLPPERRRRSQVIAACGCCCCCCCLHTLGGLIGAAAGSWVTRLRTDDPQPTGEEARDRHASVKASTIYWWAFGLLSLPVVALYESRAMLDGLLVLLIGAPVVQIGASLVSLLIVGVAFKEGKGAALRKVGRITWRSLLGTLIGLGIMFALFKGISGSRP
jgi:hypothetical protein